MKYEIAGTRVGFWLSALCLSFTFSYRVFRVRRFGMYTLYVDSSLFCTPWTRADDKNTHLRFVRKLTPHVVCFLLPRGPESQAACKDHLVSSGMTTKSL